MRSAIAVYVVGLCLIQPTIQAQQKKPGSEVQGAVKAAGLRFYLGTLFGDATEYLKVARMPLCVIRDGTITHRNEKETRDLLAGFADRNKKASLTDDDRKRITSNAIAVLEDSGIEFLG